MNRAMQALPFQGIHTDSLGHYLSGLGLLRAAARRWPEIRSCWRNEHFWLIADAIDYETLAAHLLEKWQPTAYERWWKKIQKDPGKLWRERNCRPVEQVQVLDSHVVAATRSRYNPIFGSGGNIGRRDLARVWRVCRELCAKPDSGAWLNAALIGDPTVSLPEVGSTGTWFVFANKTFNSGQEWSREGRLSPWSFLLAFEGALSLCGGVSRRLGSRARPYAVFPFISDPAQPATAGEVGLGRAEFWAPLWGCPATLSEVEALFQRGLAQVGGRPAQAPHEFALAARAAGVDGGVTEFVRFELRQTTSSQVFEALPREHIQVNPRPDEEPDARLLLQVVKAEWLTHPLLAEPRDGKQRGKFKGIVGPIEGGILCVSEDPRDEGRWQQLLRFLARGQTRIDHNKNLRDACHPLPWLSPDWFGRAWPNHLRALPPEVLLARAIASIGARSDYPLLLNVYGVESVKGKSPVFSRSGRPQRAVWHSGDALEVLTSVIQRRLVDAEELAPVPLQGTQASDRSLIDYFLHADTPFLEVVVSWVPALALMNWSERADHLGTGGTPTIPDGLSLLDMLFRPIFQPENLRVRDNLLFRKAASRPHAATARRLFHLIQYGQLDEAIQVARNRYLAAGHAIIAPRIGTLAGTDDCRRLAAAFLIPATREAVANDFEKWWLTPKKRSSHERRTHVSS